MSCYERVNEFRINLTARKELGYGSQGTVYPGISLITKDPVAAKRRKGICKEYFNKDEFEKEADLLLNRIPPHENIIKVLDFTKTEYEDKDIPKLDLWLITELCEFGNLKEFAFSRDLSIEQKIEFMYQSALAVRHLHGCKPESIAHRDVKPENILLTGNEKSPTVKLCDFGSAKSVTNKDGKSVAMWSLAGTRRYQAPEQVECHDAHSKYDKQVDIFSLGITFLALLKSVKGSLMSPETINEKGLGEIMWIKHKIREDFSFPIHEPSDSALVSAVKAVIENMIRFEPSSRLTAAQVVEELSKLRKGHPAPQPTPATDPQPAPATVPQPAPATDPQPAPPTDPQLAPATHPQPVPPTDPQPAPATDPEPAPATETWLPGTKVVALFSYEARYEDELSFEEYDVLTIIKSTTDDPDWYKVEDQSRNTGLIPSNFVRRGREVQVQKSVMGLHGEMTLRQAHALFIGKEIPETMTNMEMQGLSSDKDVGTYLVHAVENSIPGYAYALCVVGPTKLVKHYVIFKRDTKLTIDDIDFFEDLQQLVMWYEKDTNYLCTNLRKPLVNDGDLRLYADSGEFLREGWTISISKLNILGKCFSGFFTNTYKGEYSGREVSITKRKDPHSVQDTLAEAAVMTGLSHKNLVQLIGVVLGDETVIVTEFLSKGRLCDYLRSQGHDGITRQDQMSFARDVCRGMKYLEQNNILHRNLLARSVLLSEEGTARVGDFIFAHPVNRCKAVKNLPLRWSAPEAMRGDKITSKSDVWSFGVLLWEIYSFGSEPYSGIPNKDIPTHVEVRGRLEAPDGCPHKIYRVMLAAWDIDPTKRPTFFDLCKILDKVEVDMHMTCRDSLEEDWDISQSEVHILDNLYTGELTDTYKGEYSGREVFIRKRKDPHSVQDARIEAAIMTGLSHKNLVQLSGVVHGDETLIVTEFLTKSRLFDCLRSQGPGDITNQDQMSFARDVCHGMQYLEQKHIVHRNLWAQSVLVSEDGTAKVGDFSLAHLVDHYKTMKHIQHRWSAPEALIGGKVTSKADVWSFGVLLWEIYSYGQHPYRGISNEDILTHVMDGGRLEAPDRCPGEIYRVMLAAWDIDPAKRPTFSDVCKILDRLKMSIKQHRSGPLKIVKTLFRR